MNGVPVSILEQALPVARFEFELRQLDALRLPHYAGSMLRGAFGHALRRAACVTREPECKPCPLYRSCVFPNVFDTPAPESNAASQAVNPYVIEGPAMGGHDVAPGETWRFGFVLAGRMLRQMPLVVHAWQRACESGFRQAGSRAELVAVRLQGGDGSRCVYDPAVGRLEPFEASRMAAPVQDRAACLRFVTPLRLQENGRILNEREIDARRILMILARRTQNLLDCHGERELKLPLKELAVAAGGIEAEVRMRRHQWSRYSSRQRQEMDLTGLVGDVILRGDLVPFHELIALGELLHLGKNATFGLGRYQLITENP